MPQGLQALLPTLHVQKIKKKRQEVAFCMIQSYINIISFKSFNLLPFLKPCVMLNSPPHAFLGSLKH